MNLKSIGSAIGSAFGPVGSVVGSVAGSLIGKKSQDNTNQANMELAKYQYEKNLEMWNKQNEYNSPASQMKRYEEAGLNPNLIYGTGTSSAGNSTSAPSYSAPTMRAYTDYGDLGVSQAINSYNSMRTTEAQLGVLASVADKNEAEAAYARARTNSSIFDYNLNTDTRDLLVGIRRKNHDLLGERIGLTKAQNNYLGVQKEALYKNMSKIDAEIELMAKRGKLTDAQALQVKQNILNMKKRWDILELQRQAIQWQLDTNPDSSLVKELRKQATILETRLNEIRNDWYDTSKGLGLNPLKFELFGRTFGSYIGSAANAALSLTK